MPIPGKEGDLGPLWKETPKLFGFRLAIPHPQPLCAWLIDTARMQGDSVRDDLDAQFIPQAFNFLLSQSSRKTPWERA